MNRGKKNYALIGLLFGFVMLGGAISCQKDDSNSPVSPAVNIPTFPKAEQRADRESFAAENFYANENSACQLSARPEKESFLVSVPAGDFRITYTTWLGTFYVAARAEKCATLRIGLSPCDEVKSVSIQRGAITGIGCSTWPSGPVTLYSWPCGGTAECSQVFASDGTSPIVLLDGGGSSVNPLPTCPISPVSCSGNNCSGASAPVQLQCPGFGEGRVGITSPRTDTFIVEMGRAAGKFRFYHETYTVPDRMVISYEGRTLFDSGCNGAEGTESLSYSGRETHLTVTVSSLCSWGNNTDWNFEVGCPQ
ncbi:reverse gyrase [Candidatus Moduliflexus flocculans]|uniref:Reverse gyrase n=1 Tax=Candidatus Moduliflexus flocculans TaxID=1499966 RepID=A0A081BPM0_9BACT|nr:reverse gyrase [Candidatus Moduliflexus flocculans]